MRKSLAIFAFCATICFTVFSQTVRDLRLNAPVDSNTIAVAYNLISNAVAVASRLGILDQESLARAIQVGQDLSLIQTSTNGWAIAVDNIVEVDQAHVPGVLFVGDTIYGAPSTEKGRIDFTGCDFWYDRQIPDDPTGQAGWGNIVTDPYMDWRLGSFFQQWGETNAAMWAALMGINNLPASLAADLQAYSSATGGIAQSISTFNGIKDEINATNAVIRSVIESALAQASGGGGGQSWTTASTSSSTVQAADHCITECSYGSGWEVTVFCPSPTGFSHFIVWFSNAYSLGDEYGAYVNWGYDGNMYGVGDYSSFSQYNENYNVVLFDVREIAYNTWFVVRYCAY